MRRVAQFLLWLGLFGGFLFAAAYSTGDVRYDLLVASALLVLLSATALRKPQKPFEPSRRFRTLRKLGLTGREPEEKKN
ncbi:MAG TPA: hypothetical protein VLK33_14525 [Terriglobales bacterium]|nr:hypothetical protein [Terriglobales bacterium]